jgi:hypothetical protein
MPLFQLAVKRVTTASTVDVLAMPLGQLAVR